MLLGKDWRQTKFGPMAKWPPSLLSMVSLLINAASPMALWYGKEHLVIYNDAYIPVAGNKHPTCFGASAAEYWGEAWAKMEPIFTGVMNGESVDAEDSCVFVERERYTEVFLHSILLISLGNVYYIVHEVQMPSYVRSYAPWRGENGAVAGFLNRIQFLYPRLTLACFENTGRVIADRRLRTLGELDFCIASAVTMNDLGKSVSKAFTFNTYDIPFALVYFCSTEFGTTSHVVDSGLERRSTSDSSGSTFSEPGRNDRPKFTYTLQSTVGIPEGHMLAPRVVEINPLKEKLGDDLSTFKTSSDVWPFKKMATEQTEIDVTLASDSLEGIRWQGWPDPPKSAVAVPIFGAREMNGKEVMTGMLIMGINPRREFDDDYLSWIRICSRHIAAAMSVTKSAAEAAQRVEDLAQLNRNRTAFFNR
jgi:hypothetical protein